MECRIRLASAGGHNEQDTVFSLGNRLDDAVDCDSLVVAWRDAVMIVVIGGRRLLGLFLREPMCYFVTFPKLFWRRKLIEGYLSFFAGGHIMLKKCMSIGAVSEVDVEDDRIFDSLLHTIANRLLVILCFNNGQRLVDIRITKLIVGFITFIDALPLLSIDGDFPVGEKEVLTRDLRKIPARILNSRSNLSDLSRFFSEITHSSRLSQSTAL